MRDVLIHHCDQIQYKKVRETATEDIPDLLKFVERLLEENPPPQSGDQR